MEEIFFFLLPKNINSQISVTNLRSMLVLIKGEWGTSKVWLFCKICSEIVFYREQMMDGDHFLDCNGNLVTRVSSAAVKLE